jgi:hypothetical protein
MASWREGAAPLQKQKPLLHIGTIPQVINSKSFVFCEIDANLRLQEAGFA